MLSKILKKFHFLKSSLIPLLIFMIVSIIFCYEILTHLNYWGGRDWDQFTFWNAVPRTTILKYHQFPLWNPYTNGGNVLLAHPHSSFLSPFYIFVLLFGPVVGIKIEIIVYLILGMWGMLLLSRYLKIYGVAAYFSSFIYMLSAIYPLHVSEGHMSWLPFSLISWLFLSYLKSIGNKKYILLGIFFLSLILLAGSVDVFNIAVFLIFIYAVLKTFQERRISPLSRILVIFIGTFLVCSVKLIPMLEFLFHNYQLTYEQDGVSLAIFLRILLSPAQAIFDSLSVKHGKEILGLTHRWHEYGAYIGVIPLFLSILGGFIYFRKRWPLIVLGGISLLIVLGDKSPINIWKILHFFPIYNALKVPSRFMFGFIFCSSLFSGMGLLYIRKLAKRITVPLKVSLARVVSFSLILFVLFDLYLINAPIFKNVFWITPLELEKNPYFAQRYDYANFLDGDNAHSSMYPIFLSNSGLLHAYEVMHVRKGDVSATFFPGYKGEVYLHGGNGSVAIIDFSPNRVVVDANITDSDTLVLNQNYYKGWRVKGNGNANVMLFDGLVSAAVEPGRRMVIFYYFPVSFFIGLLVSGITCIGIIFYFSRKGGVTD